MRLIKLFLAVLLLLAPAQSVRASEGFVSTLNSTTTPLANGASFVGTFEDVHNFDVITVTSSADNISTSNGAVDTLSVQFSTNGVNSDQSEGGFSCFAKVNGTTGAGFALNIPIRARYFRVRYANGSANMTVFHLQCTYRYTGCGPTAQWSNVTFPNFAIFPSASRTLLTTLSNYQRWGGRGLLISLNVSTSSTAVLTIRVLFNPNGGAGLPTSLASLATTASVNQQYYLIVYPECDGTSDSGATRIKSGAFRLGRLIQIQVSPSSAVACTYELSVQELP